MAIDTATKRASLLRLVLPDGDIGRGDRRTLLGLYSALLDAPVTAVGMVDVTVSVAAASVALSAYTGEVDVSWQYAALSVLASLSTIVSTAHPRGFRARLYQDDGALAWATATQRSKATLGFYGAFTGDYRQLYA